MIILDTALTSLEIGLVDTVITNQLPVVSSFVDIGSSNFGVTEIGSQDTASNDTTAVTIVSAPASGKTRQIKAVFIQNEDTFEATVIVQLNNNSTLRQLIKITLQPDDTLQYIDGQGWSVIASPFISQELGQTRENSTNAVSVYEAITPTKITSITLCNVTGSPANFSLFLDVNGTTYDESTALYFEAPLPANSTLTITAPYFMNAGNLAYQNGTANAITITASGEVKT